MHFLCPSCRHLFASRAHVAGRSARCPRCRVWSPTPPHHATEDHLCLTCAGCREVIVVPYLARQGTYGCERCGKEFPIPAEVPLPADFDPTVSGHVPVHDRDASHRGGTSGVLFICGTCRCTMNSEYTPGHSVHCWRCGGWIAVPPGPVGEPPGRGPRPLCPGCQSVGTIEYEAGRREFRCPACGLALALLPPDQDVPPPPPTARRRWLDHGAQVWALIHHEVSEWRVPKDRRCRKKSPTDPVLRTTHRMCPHCQHWNPSGMNGCESCRTPFTGRNAWWLEQFNLYLEEELDLGGRRKKELRGCGCFFLLIGAGALALAVADTNSLIFLLSVLCFAIAAGVMVLDWVITA